MNRDNYLRNISDHLGRIAHQVEARNSIQLFDLNISAEDFYNGLLNIIYNLNLVNLNKEEQNKKAIDLGDRSARICIQVTSDNSIEKIKSTVDKFDEDGLDVDYDNLMVLLLTRKKKYNVLPTPSKVKLSVKDYIDLLKDIRNICTTIDHLKKIVNFLEKELVTDSQSRSKADSHILETFADNAARYITQVAQQIVVKKEGLPLIHDLNSIELLEKFKKMKCSPSYKRKFDRHAVFFPTVDEIILTDAVDGGAETIRSIIGIIENIYYEVLDQSINGDRIHSHILASLLENHNYSPEETIAAEVLILFTVNECGIFNEVK